MSLSAPMSFLSKRVPKMNSIFMKFQPNAIPSSIPSCSWLLPVPSSNIHSFQILYPNSIVATPISSNTALSYSNNMHMHMNTNTNIISTITSTISNQLQDALWFLKRTFQPSVIRKRRKHGFLERHKSVGGRRVLKRRIKKGRYRLGGC